MHGGGWEGGDKQTYITYIFEPLSQAGFAWFSIDYRLAPKHPFPAAVDDVRRADPLCQGKRRRATRWTSTGWR